MLWCSCTGINLTPANYFVLLEVKCHPVAQTEMKLCPKLKFPYLHLTTDHNVNCIIRYVHCAKWPCSRVPQAVEDGTFTALLGTPA